MVPLTREEFLDDLAQVQSICAYSPILIPTVTNGILHACNSRRLPAVTPDLPVEDFVLGMEALKLTFHLVRHFDGSLSLYVSMSQWKLPVSWQERARELSAAFPPERYAEVSKYLEDAGVVFDTTANPICRNVILETSARAPAR